MSFVEQYLLQLNTEKRRWRQMVLVLTLLSLIVALTTTWSLRLTGITIANSATCQMEEHQHSDTCSVDCQLEEHIHNISCYSDTTVDVETPEIWETSLPSLTGHKPTDIVLVAQSQLGCGESEKNYQVADDGVTKHGITRYGQWYGNPYGEWANMFTSFCLRYAGIADAPMDSGADVMRLEFEKNKLYRDSDYKPSAGDVVFFDKNANGTVDTTAIIVELQDATLTVVEGDVENVVVQTTYDVSEVSGYGITSPDSTLMMYAAAPKAPVTYTVWLDGTNGDIMDNRGSDNISYSVSEGATMKLPSEWKSPKKYAYKLQGWVDINTGDYYPGGAQLTVTKDMVLYADWVAQTYDIGQNNSQVVNTVSTNNFIDTNVFDYNILFNLLSNKVTSKISSDSHTESWSHVGTGKVTYKNQSTLDFSFNDHDTSSKLANPTDRNAPNTYTGGTSIYPGIYNDTLGEVLFSTENAFNPQTGEGIIGKHYVGKGDHLFRHDLDPTSDNFGYYYYDAKKNAASYNQADGRFYIYDYLSRTSDSAQSNDSQKYSDFLPFNSPYANNNGQKVVTYTYNGLDGEYNGTTHYQYDGRYTENGSSDANSKTNYLFGMSIDVNFYLSNVPGTKDANGEYGNRDVYGNEMHFKFEGDDDVWVLVDGKVVLDVGGIHGVAGGDVNFSTGIVTTTDGDTTTLEGISAGDHVLTIYYLERGSSLSNCAIYFNLAPRFFLTIQKEDVLTRELLNGAQFSVYTDFKCTKPAILWQSEQDKLNGAPASNVFTVTNGKATLWGFGSSNTYYIKETRPPDKDGYTCANGVICLMLDKKGVASYSVHIEEQTDENGNTIPISNGFTVHGFKIDEQTQEAYIVITNAKESVTQTTSVFAAKQWSDGSDHSGGKVTAYLNMTDEKGVVHRIREVELSEANNWRYTWDNLPKYHSDGKTEVVYTVTEALVSGYFGEVEKLETKSITTVAWNNATSFSNGVYILKTDNGCLSAVSESSDTLQLVTEQVAKSSPLAQWTVTKSGSNYTFENQVGQILTLKTNSPRRFYVTKTSGSYQSMTVSTSSSKLRLRCRGTGTGNYYLCALDSSGYPSASTSTGSVLNFSPLLKSSKTVTFDFKDIGYLITNSPIEVETSVSVKKSWSHPTNNTSLYEKENVVIKLLADGVDTGAKVTLNLRNNWSDTFSGLPYTNKKGEVIKYTVEEEQNDDWIAVYGDVTLVNGNYQVTVTNHYRWTSNVTLPATGGTGPPLYILIGLAFIIASFVYVFRLRRRYYERRSKE